MFRSGEKCRILPSARLSSLAARHQLRKGRKETEGDRPLPLLSPAGGRRRRRGRGEEKSRRVAATASLPSSLSLLPMEGENGFRKRGRGGRFFSYLSVFGVALAGAMQEKSYRWIEEKGIFSLFFRWRFFAPRRRYLRRFPIYYLTFFIFFHAALRRILSIVSFFVRQRPECVPSFLISSFSPFPSPVAVSRKKSYGQYGCMGYGR